MYALCKRHSGRISGELTLYIRGWIPSFLASGAISAASKFPSIGELSSSAGRGDTRRSCRNGRIVGQVLPGGMFCNAFRRTSSGVQASRANAQECNLVDNRVRQGHRTTSAYFQLHLGGPCRQRVALPVGFARYASSGDCDNRESDERQRTVPLADGEGDERDSEKEHVLSVKDSEEEDLPDQSSALTGELSGGEDDGEDYREHGPLRREGRNKPEDEKERVVWEEANAKAYFGALKAKFRKEFEKRIVDWQGIDVDLPNFPYYLSDSTRELLLDCVGAHLRHPDFAAYGSGLPSSSRRIMINGQSGTELYQEKLVQAVAHNLQASLLVIDSTVLSPHDFGDQESSSDSDGDGSEDSQYEEWGASDSKWQEKDSTMDNGNDESEDNEAEKHSDDETYKMPVVTLLGVTSESAEAIRRKLLEVFGGLVNVLEVHNQKSGGDSNEQEQGDSQSDFSVKKGDRVKYIGDNTGDPSDRSAANSISGGTVNAACSNSGRQVLKAGQRGRVVSVPKHMTGKVGVKFDRLDSQPDNLLKDNRKTDYTQKTDTLVEWCDLSDLEPDDGPAIAHSEEWFAALEALCEVASTSRPLIIYLPDPRQWFERAVSLEQRPDFLIQVEDKFDELVGPLVIIAGRTNEEDPVVDDKKRLEAHLNYIRQRYVQPRLNSKSSSKFTVQEILGTEDIYELFANTVNILPPQDEDSLQHWNNHLIMHKGICQAKWNLRLLSKVLELHNMECSDLSMINLYGLRLTSARHLNGATNVRALYKLNLLRAEAENIVGWARNHLLASCISTPTTNNGKLMIPRDSLERALTRLRDNDSKKSQTITKDYKIIAEDEYEKALITAVIPPHEVGVKFDHIGSLENVKQALRELVMLPLQRPELFSKGNLTRPCKGVLLFGPPGTGKTLLAKAVATEAGANFINITGSTITSKWFGDAEKLTKALFSLAKKLSPAVIFVDEVDSLLGARGGTSEHEATRKTRNEFMAAWDGLRSKDNERVLVLAATNRPFDLDDAVIRRLPRRILVDLPTAENRVKILRVILAEEELEADFDFERLANMTDGYSGSDLKNLSIAAAYRPIRELLDAEAKAQAAGTLGAEAGSPQFTRGSSTAVIRALRLDDFREGMQQVGASIAYDASSMNELRRWNEQYGEGGNRRRSTFGFTL